MCFYTSAGSFRHLTCCATATFCGCCAGSKRGTLQSRTPSAPIPSLFRVSSLPPSGQSSSPVVGTHTYTHTPEQHRNILLHTHTYTGPTQLKGVPLKHNHSSFQRHYLMCRSVSDILKGWNKSCWVLTQIVVSKCCTVSLISLFWYQWGWCLGIRGLCNDTSDKRRAAQARAAFVCTCSRLISLALTTVRNYEIHCRDLAGTSGLTWMTNST